jgi:hypothetical protein
MRLAKCQKILLRTKRTKDLSPAFESESLREEEIPSLRSSYLALRHFVSKWEYKRKMVIDSTSMAHAMEATLREAYAAFGRGDIDGYLKPCV